MVNPVGGANPVLDNQYSGQKTQNTYNEAVSDLNNQNYQGAFQNFAQIISTDQVFTQQNPSIYYYAGISAEYAGEPNASAYLQAYVNLPDADPKMKQSAMGQIGLITGQAAMQSGDYLAAIQAFEAAKEADPSLAPQLQSTLQQLKGQVDLDLANQAQQNNDLAGMLKYYQRAAVDDPSMAPQLQSTIQQLQGQNDFNNNEWPKIQAGLQEAQNLFYPPQGTGQAGDQEKAVSILQGLLQQYPNLSQYQDPSIIYAPLAQYQAQLAAYPSDGTQGHPGEAARILEQAAKEHPTILQQDPSVYYRAAQYAWSAGHISEARQLFQQFQPYQSAYAQAFQDTTGPAQFKEQISGDANSVMANFQTYAADWVSKHIGGSSEFWQNNVLSALSGVMPGHGYYKNAGKHGDFLYNKAIHGGTSDAAKQAQEQIDQLEGMKAKASPKEQKDIDKQIDTLKANKKAIEASQTSGKAEKGQGNAANEEVVHRNLGGVLDTTSTTTRGDAPPSVPNPNDPQGANKGEGAVNDPSGPGFWGLGTTLQQQSATYKSFLNISQSNPLTLESGGQGLDDHNISVSGGMNFLNAQERVFNMVYGGNTGAGFGFSGMYGTQARADVYDEQYSVNYAGGDATIGGQIFSVNNNNALATSSLQEQSALGAQADLHGGAAIGSQGVELSGNTGAFAGAQASASANLGIMGQGGFAMAQGWAGVGAKVHGSLSLGTHGLHFDLGLGAALGVGGYVQVSGNINLLAAGQDLAAIYGTGEHSFGGMLGRTGELTADAASSTADMVKNVAGGASGLIDKAQNYFADNAAHNVFDASNAGQFGIGVAEGLGEVATDVADRFVQPELILAKEASKDVAKVGSDFSKGEIGKGLGDAVVGTAKAAYDTVKDVAITAVHAVENIFHGW